MNITAIIIVIALLSVLIFVHELGHFLAAKINGIYVQQFSIGFPPKLFRKKVGETEYVIGLIPFGGYVKLYGEDTIEEGEETIPIERAFASKSSLIQLIVLSSGVLMNFLIGIVLIMIVFVSAGRPVERYAISIDSVAENSAAARAELQEGSYVIGYKEVGETVYQEPDDFEAFVAAIKSHLNTPFVLQVAENLDARDGVKSRDITVTPTAFYEEGTGSLGVEIGWYLYTDFESLPLLQIPLEATRESVFLVGSMIEGVAQLFGSLIGGKVPEEVAGVVGIVVVSQDIVAQGIIPLLYFMALISINLAVVNLLPFPALDGGRIVFVLMESLVGRSLNKNVQQWIHLIGFAILILLMVVVTYNDIVRFIL